jgi:16S rRNA (guanine966-N2)-methyltransferase
MRISGGRLSSRRLKAGSNKKFRPTSSRVKNSIFNILPQNLAGARVLDLFAGSGSLGIEALSRNAESVVFIDQSRESFRLIKDNLRKVGLIEKGIVLNKKVSPAIKQLSNEGRRFDLVLMDPPYNKGLADKTLSLLAGSDVLDPESMVVVEHAKREGIEKKYSDLVMKDQRKYGDTRVSFFEMKR